MPAFETRNAEGERVLRYGWPAQYVTPSAEIAEALREWRKEASGLQRELEGYKRRFRDKFFKEEARHQLRMQRACTLMIPWFGEPDKGQTETRPEMWPLDLAHELDLVANRICLEFG